MKKLILVLTVLFVSCFEVEVKPREVKAQSYYTSVYAYKEEIHNGMVYGMWFVIDNTSQTGYSTSVVNLTKDALEVELIKKQLKSQ